MYSSFRALVLKNIVFFDRIQFRDVTSKMFLPAYGFLFVMSIYIYLCPNLYASFIHQVLLPIFLWFKYRAIIFPICCGLVSFWNAFWKIKAKYWKWNLLILILLSFLRFWIPLSQFFSNLYFILKLFNLFIMAFAVNMEWF